MDQRLVADEMLLEGLPPMRDRLPTLPFDLAEYARVHCGPDSWSARERDSEPVLDERTMVSGRLIGVRRSDVPRIAAREEDFSAGALDHRAGFILSLLDGCSTLDTVLHVAGLPEQETLDVLCELCARGIVTLAA